MENLILTNLIENEKYTRKVLPFLKLEYFHDRSNRIIYQTFVEYFDTYSVPPTKETLAIIISEKELNDDELELIAERFDELHQEKEPTYEWLVDETEKFCQERALYNAIQKAINVIDGQDANLTKHAIPDVLKEALSVSFDTHLGHDYFEDAEKRFEFYHVDHPRIPFDLSLLNKVTHGGCPRKTLNIILGGVNVGKTMVMVHLASAYMLMGYNVLYVSFEMSEEMISNRIDANLMDVTVNEVEHMSKEQFNGRISSIKRKTKGKLIVKEYPPGGAHVGHIRQFLSEVKMKKGFVPDVIVCDYIGIMASSRVKLANTGSYFYIKYIAEELRALAVETDCVVWTATQVNRSGFNDTDIDMTKTAESFGLPATADFMISIIRTEELDEMGQLMVKQLKSRYGNKNWFEKFLIGVNVDKMQLYDVEDSVQTVQNGARPPEDTENKADKYSTFKI